MADWLNIAGGAGKGYVEGQQDLQRTAEFNALQAQRQRVVKQQQMDDELAATLRKVRPAGTYTDTDSSPEAGAEGPPSPTVQASRPTTTTTISAADADRQRADIMARGGRLQDLQAAATLRQNAYQAEQQAEQQRQREGFNVLRQAKMLRTRGDPASLEAATRLLQQGYSQYPDGHEITVENRNGVPHVGVAGPDGRYVQQPVPITGESVDALINQGVSMLSPEMMTKQQELGIHQQTANAATTTAQAAQQHAQTAAEEAWYKTKGRGGDDAHAETMSKSAYYNALAGWENVRGSLDRQSAKANQVQQFVDDKTGQTVFASPVRDKTGKIVDWERQAMPVGLRPLHQVAPWDAEQAFYAKQLELHETNGTGPYTRTKDGKVDQSKVDAWKAEHRLNTPSGSTDPIAAAVNRAGPPPPDKAAPTKAAPAPAAPQRSTMERITDEGAKSKARDAIATAQDQLKAQFASGKILPADFARSWATLGAQMQAIQ